MSVTCTTCGGTGFLNLHLVPDAVLKLFDKGKHEIIQDWMEGFGDPDVTICDCCGDPDGDWFGIPGEHYNDTDPAGPGGPYEYNGGLCECN